MKPFDSPFIQDHEFGVVEESYEHTETNHSVRLVDATEMVNDRTFYDEYNDLVDTFIDAICSADSTRSDLRGLISKADRTLARDTGSEDQESNLINRLSFRHEPKDGRTPLSYAVAKNLKQKVYDLIDLGADISKVMPQLQTSSDDENASSVTDSVPKTALVIASTNQKRDGTEMVRILLSKGADPSELAAACVDENTMSLGMKYWINKARRIGIPAQEELLHMAQLPPMDRIHELDYAVVGEEAAVSVIQEALAGRFGNPSGNRKPLVMLFLGPPGKFS